MRSGDLLPSPARVVTPAPVLPTSRGSGVAGLPVFGVSGERGLLRVPTRL
jgi:hypothetical protein